MQPDYERECLDIQNDRKNVLWSAESRKNFKKGNWEKKKKWRVLEPGTAPGLAASCIECCVEIESGTLANVIQIKYRYLA